MKILSKIITVTSIIIMLWFAASYIEIVCKNLTPNPEYSNHNVIVNLTKRALKYHGLDK